MTICTQNRKCYFEQFSELREIITKNWNNIPNRFPNTEVDEFVLMPNHIHGIILIHPVGAGLAPAHTGLAPAHTGLAPAHTGLAPAHTGLAPAQSRTDVGADFTPAQTDLVPAPDANRATARVAPTFGQIVGAFKSLCVHDWLQHIKKKNLDALGKFWQRNYYEHIIRNEDELNIIREYIHWNPMNWEYDWENPEFLGKSAV